MEIYQPAEDSYLIQKKLIEYLGGKPRNLKILDMGTGSGILAKTCKNIGFKNIIAADINKNALKHLKKQKIKAIYSCLFSNIKEKFDLIIFNPPYLPENKHDQGPDTTAGKKGYELIIEFLKQAKSHLNRGGKIILLFSSLSRPDIIKRQAKKLSYDLNKLATQKLFFETLFVYMLN